MDRNRLLSLGVAALCMVSVGLSATTLDSTVSQDPGEAIDFRSDLVPLGDGTVMEIARQVERNEDGGGGDANAERDGRSSGASSDGTADESAGSDGSDGGERMDDRDSSEAGARPDDARAESVGSGEGTGPDDPDESLLDRLLALLESLVPLLVALAALALAYRYRERLLALLSLPAAAVGSADAATDGGDGREPWPPVEPADDVDRAWCALVRELDVERPWTKTPGECRRAAVEDGFDPEAVETLTRIFREKHYGDAGPTDDHLERARQCVDRIGLGGRPR